MGIKIERFEIESRTSNVQTVLRIEIVWKGLR